MAAYFEFSYENGAWLLSGFGFEIGNASVSFTRYEVIVPFIYEWVYKTFEGITLVTLNNKQGLLDKNWAEIVPPGKNDGMALVQLDNKWGFVDMNGDIALPFEYDYLRNFTDGLAVAMYGSWDEGKWGFIDKNGREIIPFEFDQVGHFADGVAAVMKDGKWGFISIK